MVVMMVVMGVVVVVVVVLVKMMHRNLPELLMVCPVELIADIGLAFPGILHHLESRFWINCWLL